MSAEALPTLSPQSSIDAQVDGSVRVQHAVLAQDGFERAAQDVFVLLKTAQERHPGRPRRLVITIDGHHGERAGYDADFFEFQQEFLLGAIGPFFSWIETPLTGELTNSHEQQDSTGEVLRIGQTEVAQRGNSPSSALLSPDGSTTVE